MIFDKWRVNHRKGLMILISLFFICIAGLVFSIIYYSFFHKTSKTILPVYEEIYASKTSFQEKIKEIDYAIYDAFYNNGIREKDVFFQDVEPRRINGYAWDFAELTVRCRDVMSAQNVVALLFRTLSDVGTEVDFRKQAVGKNGIVCHVFVNGYHTHRIFLKSANIYDSKTHVRPKLAIIIDDLGYDKDMAFSFMQLDIPVTFSVFPVAPYTDDIVKMANEAGREILLHLPMEPKNYPFINPGPGTLFLSMSADQIRGTLAQDLGRVPLACGVNNHMGSSFTESRSKMIVVLKELKRRHLFYIDSRTTSGTVGFKLAEEIGLPAAERNVFLDNELDLKAIRIQMERLLSLARHKGSAIGIAHPYKETLEVLKEYQPSIKTEFKAVCASDMVS
jgi:polysaccharide deacetylase 2 family uncharacterized protein YibQ